MARNINVVVITGNLTRDPELKHTPGGTAVCSLGVAVNGSKKVNDEWVDDANFFDVTVWGQQGESCAQYLSKGRPVAIHGRLDWRSWTADDGGKRSKVEIIADSVQFLNASSGEGGERSSGSSSGQSTAGGDEPTPTADFDDIPF